MPHTDHPPTHSAEVAKLLKRLAALHTERAEVLAQLRRGSLADRRDALLFELCGFRGLTYTEAGEIIGMTREGVGRRLRPAMHRLDGLTFAERSELTDVPRPYRARRTKALLEQLRAASDPAATSEANRALGETARGLREEMVAVINDPRLGHLTLGAIAGHLDISLPTLQRVRGKM